MGNDNFAMMCRIIDNRNEDEKFIDKSKCLADTLAMYIDRINRLYRGIRTIVIGSTYVSLHFSAKPLTEYTDIFVKDIKQLNYQIHDSVAEYVSEFIKLYNPNPVYPDTNKVEYDYYINHFILDCKPGGAYYKALNMTKYKRLIINEAESLKSSGQELGAKLYGLALNLQDLELYLKSLLKQISKCKK